jgi:hypothetical protein
MQGSTEERTIAMQYINGVVDGLYQAEALAGREYLCAPAAVTLGQMRDVVRKHLDSYPSTRHLLAGSLVYVALSSAWPCPPAAKK